MQISECATEVKTMAVTRTHFTFRVDTWTADGESIVEHVAGVEVARPQFPQAKVPGRQGNEQDQGKAGGGETAGGWSKMSNEPIVREREPTGRVRARLEALARANAAPRCGARSKRSRGASGGGLRQHLQREGIGR